MSCTPITIYSVDEVIEGEVHPFEEPFARFLKRCSQSQIMRTIFDESRGVVRMESLIKLAGRASDLPEFTRAEIIAEGKSSEHRRVRVAASQAAKSWQAQRDTPSTEFPYSDSEEENEYS